ncbi:MAG TPA: septum site-determining protein Ssd [Angustibacter sp.]|nr:septum site-determining protein Ssd [Angustibacter sp.]
MGAVADAESPTPQEGLAMAPTTAHDHQTTTRQGVAAVTAFTTDTSLADELQRLAAAAAVTLTVQPELPAAVHWPRGLVLVGADLASAAGRRRRPAARELVLVALDLDDGVRSWGGEARLWQDAVAAGAEQVALLPQATEWLLARLARAAEPTAAARVIGVVGGCGGAGASVLAAALAVVAAGRGRRTLLVDADALGGGIDLLVGLDDVAGLRWADLATARGRLPGVNLHASLPRAGAMAVLGWGRGEPVDLRPAAVDAVLDAGRRAHDLVVVDLPRSLDAVTQTALARVDELLVVLPARLRAVAAASQVVAAFGAEDAVSAAVVRTVDGRWSGRQVAESLGLALAAQLRDDPHLDADVSEGVLPGQRPRSHLRRAAEQCLQRVAQPVAA